MWCRKRKGGKKQWFIILCLKGKHMEGLCGFFGNRGIGKVTSPSGKQKWCPSHWREEEVAKTTTRKAMLVLTEKTSLESVLDALGGR